MRHLFRAAALFSTIAMAACGSAHPAQGPGPTHKGQARGNPVFADECADPMVLRVSSHNYWAYCTSQTSPFLMLHSSDLIHWSQQGTVFSRPPSWTAGDLWAPDVVYRGGTYFVYYTALGMAANAHCVAVATGPAPRGPFRTRNVIGCRDAHGSGYIDPDAFIAPDGKAYLYVSVDNPKHNISVIPLSHDLLHAAGPRHTLFGLTQRWEHGTNFSTVEGPFMIQRNGTYYLFFSGNDWNGAYAMGYATSRSPTGPFTLYAGNPILRGTKCIHGPGGGSVVVGPNGKDFLVYHAWQSAEGYSNGGTRDMRVDPIIWRGATATVQETPTHCSTT